jgi:hypothetical protein
MPTFDPAPPDVPALVQDVLSDRYPDLVEAGVTISCLKATANVNKKGRKTGPALKSKDGHPAAAQIKVNGYKDRVEGKADATLMIDWDEWPGWTDQQRLARIHHECHHLLIVRAKDGSIKLDKALRPRLKLRLHDLVLGGFAEIAKLYGEDSGEAAQAEAIPLRHVQLLWNFADADHEPRSGRRGATGRRKVASGSRAAAPSGTPHDAATAPLEGQGVLIDDLDRRDDQDGPEAQHRAPEVQDGLQGDPGDPGDAVFDAGTWAGVGEPAEVGA